MTKENKLANLESSSIAELQNIAKDVKKYIDTENDATLEMAMQKINQMPNFFQKLFPSKFQKMQENLTMRKMQSVYDAKERMFEIYTGIQLEIARQQGDALIAATGMHLRDQLTKFAEARIRSLTETLEISRNEFSARMKRQLLNIENYEDFPELAEPYHQSLKDEISIYFSSIKDLLEGFREALNRKVIEIDK